jgi:broad specificity phosphatase PhoE
VIAVELILVQHAEKARAAAGGADAADPGLTERGRQQARLTGERLHELGVRHIIASPFRRTYETAILAAEALGLAAQDVETDPRLRERMNWGAAAIPQTLPEFLADWSRATANRDYVPSAGDSSRAAGARILAVLEELASRPRGAAVALATHGGVTVDLLRTLIGDDDLHSRNPHLIAHGVPGCALTRLVRDEGGGYQLLELASVEHLPIPLRTDWHSD